MSAASITVEDVGPIHRLEIPVPEGGGVVVLRGHNGAGKSHALAAIQSLAGSGRPEVRDGVASAWVSGLGVRMSVGRRTVRSGELEIRLLEGEDPSLLVDPRMKDPAAADRRRIESLLRLAGVQPDLGMFAGLVEGGIDDLVRIADEETRKSEDVPTMAARLKRAFESAARKAETAATGLRGQEQALRQHGLGVDLSVEDREEVLQDALQSAVLGYAKEESRQADARRRIDEAARARAEMEAAGQSDQGASVAECQESVHQAEEVVDELTAALRDASARLDLARAQLEAADRREKLLSRWRAVLDAAEQVEEPNPAVLADLHEARHRARKDVEIGGLVRQVKRWLEEADGKAEQAKESERRAAHLRMAAAGVEGVLSEAIAKVAPAGLRVESGRLVVSTDRGESTPYAELSPGERWRIAFDVALSSVGGGGMLVIPQEAWESLDPENREEVHWLAVERCVVVFTAEADRGEVRAEAVA